MREPATSSTTGLALWLLFATTLAAWAVEGGGREPTPAGPLPACFGELREVALPESLSWALDVRWANEREVAISGVNAGVIRLRIDEGEERAAVIELAAEGRRTATGTPSSLGVSSDYLAVGAGMLSVAWKRREAATLEGEDYFEIIWDLDVHQDQLLVLGVRKNEEGTSYEEEGAFAWLGPLGGPNLANMRPLAFPAKEGHGHAMGGCATAFVGAARFLEDGSFVVVPIGEPSLYLFRANGRLQRTWQNEEFGLDGGCTLTEKQTMRMNVDLSFRMEWINQRAIVDDILPLGEGRFGLLVRRREAGVIRWRMEIADRGGRVGNCELPFAEPNSWVHLRADRRGERVVLLRKARVDQMRHPRPAIPPRLYIAPLTGAALASPSETPPPNHAGEARVPDSAPQEAPPLYHPQHPW